MTDTVYARMVDETDKEAPAAAPQVRRPVLGAAAYHGIAGEIALAADAVSEADPAAVLAQLLVMYGVAIGSSPHWRVNGEKHQTNLFVVVVGPSARGRKGTSLSVARTLIFAADPTLRERVASGIGSGEALIDEVADPVVKEGRDGEEVTIQEGVIDKRLMLTETEWAGVLAVASRQGATLSSVLRNSWDGGFLRVISRNRRVTATRPHIGMIGHITPSELLHDIRDTDIRGGLGNRIIWVWSESDKMLPDGGEFSPEDYARFVGGLTAAIKHGTHSDVIPMSEASRDVWGRNGGAKDLMYAELKRVRPGISEELCTRAFAQVRRLAVLYALLDMHNTVEPVHLSAAKALWDYSEATTLHVFGDALGNPLAEDIMCLLRELGSNGASRSDIRKELGGKVRAKKIEEALAYLNKIGLAWMRMSRSLSGGPDREMWFAKNWSGQ